jgi:hypothetical protein
MDSMASKKKLCIGITINLENYENLRLQVDGEVTDLADADELVMYLDGVLSRLGRSDETTAKHVDSYRHRVLARPEAFIQEEERREEPAIEMLEEEEEVLVTEESGEVIQDGDLSESLYHKPLDAECVGENADHAKERAVCVEIPCEEGVSAEICEGAPTAPIPPKKEVEEPQPKEAAYVCSVCGTEITRAQDQLSQLFMGKSLCKKCMDEQG